MNKCIPSLALHNCKHVSSAELLKKVCTNCFLRRCPSSLTTQNFGRISYKSWAELLLDFPSAEKYNEAPPKKTFRGNINWCKHIHYFHIISHISSFGLILQRIFLGLRTFWHNIQRTFLEGMWYIFWMFFGLHFFLKYFVLRGFGLNFHCFFLKVFCF